MTNIEIMKLKLRLELAHLMSLQTLILLRELISQNKIICPNQIARLTNNLLSYFEHLLDDLFRLYGFSYHSLTVSSTTTTNIFISYLFYTVLWPLRGFFPAGLKKDSKSLLSISQIVKYRKDNI